MYPAFARFFARVGIVPTPPPSRTNLSADRPAPLLPIPSSTSALARPSAPAPPLESPRTDPRAPRSLRSARPFPSTAASCRYSCSAGSAPAIAHQSSALPPSLPASLPAPSPAPWYTNHSRAVRKMDVAAPLLADTNLPQALPSCPHCLYRARALFRHSPLPRGSARQSFPCVELFLLRRTSGKPSAISPCPRTACTAH